MCSSNTSRIWIPKTRVISTQLRSDLEGLLRSICKLFHTFWAYVFYGACMMRVPTAAEAAHTHYVVGGKELQRLSREPSLTDQNDLG